MFTLTPPPPLPTTTTTTTTKFDFSAEIQNFIEYFYSLSFSCNADFQNINAEIPFNPSYLELCEFRPLLQAWTTFIKSLLSVYLFIRIYFLSCFEKRWFSWEARSGQRGENEQGH